MVNSPQWFMLRVAMAIPVFLIDPRRSSGSILRSLGGVALSLLFFAGCATPGPGISPHETVQWQIVRPGWWTHDDFVRLREYFTGEEDQRTRFLHRTDPRIRDGFYWKIRLRATPPETTGKLTLTVEWADPRELTPQRESLSLPSDHPIWKGEKILFFGITDEDGKPSRTPLAWRLELTGDGALLGQKESYLWQTPPAP